MSDASQFVICLGSNTPRRHEIIADVVDRVGELSDIVRRSHIYEAPDESGIGEPYINIVLSIKPSLSQDSFREALKGLERRYGRDALSKSTGIMPLDADIIIWDGVIVDSYQYSREYFQIGYREITAE